MIERAIGQKVLYC